VLGFIGQEKTQSYYTSITFKTLFFDLSIHCFINRNNNFKKVLRTFPPGPIPRFSFPRGLFLPVTFPRTTFLRNYISVNLISLSYVSPNLISPSYVVRCNVTRVNVISGKCAFRQMVRREMKNGELVRRETIIRGIVRFPKKRKLQEFIRIPGVFRNFQDFLVFFMNFQEFLGISGTTTEIQEFLQPAKRVSTRWLNLKRYIFYMLGKLKLIMTLLLADAQVKDLKSFESCRTKVCCKKHVHFLRL
jgi:hypothetical protein